MGKLALALALVLIPAAVADTRDWVLSRQREGTHWNEPSFLGTQYVSHAFLFGKWLGLDYVDGDGLGAKLLADQLPDGSWRPVPDSRDARGDFNATLLNYWALRAMALDPETPALRKAREYLLARGGLERANVFNKILLALFGNYPWSRLPSIPGLLFEPWSPVTTKRFAQWIGPHLLPIAYLRRFEVTRRVAHCDLPELGAATPVTRAPRPRGRAARALVDKMVAAQQPRGSWGGYTLATLFTLASLQDYRTFHGAFPALTAAESRGEGFLKWLAAFDTGLNGVVDDGHYWDSWLVTLGLLDSGYPAAELRATADYLAASQCQNGGFPFGVDFCHAPDADDTSMAILALSRIGGYGAAVKRAVAWLLSQQNDDGGWAAFDRNNEGNALLRSLVGPFGDSADLFDESSPDITGHVLEALAATGMSKLDAPVRRAVSYLKKTQRPSGAWGGRWAIHYLYGTSAAVVGLRQVGVDEPFVDKAVRWLLTRQNPDGGFGESSLAYESEGWAGLGASTPTQTAWVLLALAETAERAAAARAVAYLEGTRDARGRWRDGWAVGTGHPNLLYMAYPSYPMAFPSMALGRYYGSNRD